MAHRALHDYERLVGSFVPKAVGLNPQGKGDKPAYPEGAPVVTIYGGRGSGKTSVCEQLHDAYVNHLYVAKWPMPGARPLRPAPPPDEANPLTSRPLAALAWLVHELNMGETSFGRIEFPRLTYGLIAATTLYEPLETAHTGDAGDGPTLADLQRLGEMLRLLRAALLGDGDTDRTLWDSLTAWLEAAIPLVTVFAPGLAPLEDLIREVIGQARRRGGPKLSQDALRWWDQRLHTIAGTGIKKLLNWVFLSLRAQLPAQAQKSLEEHLAAAFIADINANYQRRHLRKRPLPLILLDDTHTPTGSRLLHLLLTAYAKAAGADNAQGGEVKRPVIIATELSAEARPATPQHRHPVGVSRWDTLNWRSPHSSQPTAWQVWLRAPALRADSIAAALGSPCPRGLPNVIEQISAGRAGCAWLLVEAAKEDLHTGRHSVLLNRRPEELGRALLGLPPADATHEPTVADELLRYLIPERDLIEGMLPWAAALRLEDVPGLPPLRPDQDPVHNRIRDLLKEKHWYRAQWAYPPQDFTPVIADRTLRELLLHRLRAECTPTEGFAYWTRLHTQARDRYSPQPSPAEDLVAHASYLHHSLALGLREEVVAGLHAAFKVSDRRSWLAVVQFVCAAPQPPDGYLERHPESPVFCTACPGPLPDDRHRAVNRLLNLLWDLSALSSLYTDDPESPDNRLRLLLSGFDVAYEDQDIATAEAARRWPALLAQGRRVPELPTTRRDH